MHSTRKKDSTQDDDKDGDKARHDAGHLIESTDVVYNTDRVLQTPAETMTVFRARALHASCTQVACSKHVQAVVGGAKNDFIVIA